MRRRVAIAPLLTGAAVLAGIALSAPDTARADAYEAMLTRAIAAKERALDVSEPARWEEALHLFQEADTIRSTRESKYEIGFAAERLHREDLATEAYEAAVDFGLTGSAQTKAKAFTARHAAGMARLDLRGPAGARVRIAGMDRGRLPLARPIVLFPGNIQIEIVLAEDRRAVRALSLTAGHLAVETIADDDAGGPIRQPPPQQPPDTAQPPGATIEAAGAAPAPPDGPAPAPQTGGPSPPAPPQRDRLPPPPSAGRPVAGWVILGAGVVIAAVSAVMIPIASDRLADERQALPRSCADLIGTDDCAHVMSGEGMMDEAQRHVDAIATWKAVGTGSRVGLGVGLLTAAVGGVVAAVQHAGSGAAPAAAPPAGSAERRAAGTPWVGWLPVAVLDGARLSLVWQGRF